LKQYFLNSVIFLEFEISITASPLRPIKILVTNRISVSLSIQMDTYEWANWNVNSKTHNGLHLYRGGQRCYWPNEPRNQNRRRALRVAFCQF